MAVTAERLVAILEMRLDKYEKSLAKARGQTNRQFTAIERRGKQMQARLQNIGAGVGRSFAGMFAAAVTVRGAQQLIDASTRIENALKVAGLSGEELTKVYDRLFESAQRNFAPVETLANLYSRLSLAQSELRVTNDEIANFTDKVALALRVQGVSAQEARGALTQLSQAMGGGVVRAEELNSVLEGAPTIARAAAAGLQEAGGAVSRLRELVIDGEVSSEAFFRAFEAGSVILEDKVAGAELTVSQSFVRLQNVLIDTAGKLDEGTGASERVAEALQYLGDIVQQTDFSPVINGLLDIGEAAAQVIGSIMDVSRELGRLSGVQGYVASLREAKRADQRVSDAFDLTAGTGDPERSRPTVVNVGRTVTPVSLSDYAAPAKRGGGGGRSRGGGRRGRGASAAEREADAVKKLIEELERERSLIGATDEQRKLSEALRRAGAAATGEQKAKITELVTAIEREEAAMKQMKATQEEVNSLGRDVLGGLISDLRSGTDAAMSFENALNRVADKFIDMALNSVFGGFGGGGGGLFGSLFGGFRANGGPVHAGKAYVVGERGPELFAPGRSGTVIPTTTKTASHSIVINAPINAPGADAAQLMRVQKSVDDLRKGIPAMVDSRTKTRGTRA